MVKLRLIIGILIVIGVVAGTIAGAHAQEEGLVAEWHFDEGEGNILKDSSGNGNDGVIYGAAWVDGKYGQALSFDGVDDYINIGYPGGFFTKGYKYHTDATIEVWIKPNILGGKQVIYQIGGNVQALAIGILDGRTVRFALQKDDNWKHIESTVTLSPQSWYHIVGVNGGSGYSLYLNGELAASNGDLISWGTGSDGHTIGGVYKRASTLNDVQSTTQMFNGIIDEVRIYNRALSAEEIKSQYEHGTTALSLTKTAIPQSIKQGQNTTITLTVKNTGSTEISDIEIADTIPLYLTFIDGETSKRYDSLAPKDSRQFYYTLQLNDTGTFNLEPAIATYADDKGNYNTVESKPASIEVIRSIIEDSAPTPKPTNGNVQSASVNLHGEKTDVALGEDVLLKLSAVNIIGNPIMHVQVIIIPPSGWSVTSSEFAKSGAGQYTTTYELESGGGKDIEVRIIPNQIGDDFQVDGRIIYYFGDDVGSREDHTLTLPITVRAASNPDHSTSVKQSEEQSAPGFALVVGVLELVAMALYIKRK